MATINYIQGDLLTSNEKLIVHGCNARGEMNSGIAKAIRDKWPHVFDSYRESYLYMVDKRGGMRTGQVFFVETNEPNGMIVCNAITQPAYGYDGAQYVSYDAIHEICQKLNYYCNQNNITQFGIPLIGAGLGGGNWNIIETIFRETINDDITVNVYRL